jgi:hypothetical protein
MTPIEAINTLYHDDLDVHYIDDWKFYTSNNRREMLAPQKDRSNTTRTTLPRFLKDGPCPYSKS